MTIKVIFLIFCHFQHVVGYGNQAYEGVGTKTLWLIQDYIRSISLKNLQYVQCKAFIVIFLRGWWGGAMVLDKLPEPGRPTIWMSVGLGPIALAVGLGGGCFDIFTLLYPFPPLKDRPI